MLAVIKIIFYRSIFKIFKDIKELRHSVSKRNIKEVTRWCDCKVMGFLLYGNALNLHVLEVD